ncbi:MAG: GGDEF domain-containing protein, partial [Rhizobium leguminosarum]|nr:GGDEF domain-containing protein [Rhizobium leguminosarum]
MLVSDMQVVDAETNTRQANSSLQEAWRLGCTGRSLEALTLAGEILVDAETRGDDRLAAQCDTDIAWYCFQIGKAELGLTHIRRAVDFWKLSGEPKQESYARAYFGWLLLELGLPEEA